MVLLLAAGEQGRAPGLCADVPGGCARRGERGGGGGRRRGGAPRGGGAAARVRAAPGMLRPTVRWSVRCRVDGLFSAPTALADPPHGGRPPPIEGQTAHAKHAPAAVWLP